MKRMLKELSEALLEMPPTRGHDLKHRTSCSQRETAWMPPTRGHDLKLITIPVGSEHGDAPHTGARLETRIFGKSPSQGRMPPTRGHDLKQP